MSWIHSANASGSCEVSFAECLCRPAGHQQRAPGCYERNTRYPDARVLSAIRSLEGDSGDWIPFGKESIQTAATSPDDERVNGLERRLGFVEDVLHAVLRTQREK